LTRSNARSREGGSGRAGGGVSVYRPSTGASLRVERGVNGPMRVIDLDIGETLQAANDEDLTEVVRGHYAARGEPLSDEAAARLVNARAYDATDS
jgi:hypothetical protein